MNYDPVLPNLVAVSIGLVAAVLWGSWFIVLKYLDDYPLEAFYLTLFAFSWVFVWSVGFIIDGTNLWGNIQFVRQADPSRVTLTFICGMLYVVGIQLTLYAMRILGLTISQPIQASINIIGGTALAALIGGIPLGLTVRRIVVSVSFLVAAVVLSMLAARKRNASQKAANISTGLSTDPKEIRTALVLLVSSSLLMPAYTVALSYGLKSVTQPVGLAPLPFMAVLCTGALFGALLVSGTLLTIRKQWQVFVRYGFKVHRLGVIAGLCHYGGNIIHTYATRNLSAVIAWPLGFTAGLWTSMWGLVYGEFKGSPKSVYFLLAGGMLAYLVGALLIANIT